MNFRTLHFMKLFIALLLILQTVVCGQSPDLRLKQADEEVNRMYQKIITVETRRSEVANLLRKSQRAWIAFRDASGAAAVAVTGNGKSSALELGQSKSFMQSTAWPLR